uniref:Peptidase S1 domain-containing protein n=1 Tax=Romanomermis culicivorax TaxID=13658 RepID=A0A915KT96_ROMCU
MPSIISGCFDMNNVIFDHGTLLLSDKGLIHGKNLETDEDPKKEHYFFLIYGTLSSIPIDLVQFCCFMQINIRFFIGSQIFRMSHNRTGEAVSNHHWETILFKDGVSTDCHLTWLSKARNSSQKSRDLLLTTATCLLEKPARRRAQPIYLPIPSKFSIFLIQYDAGWQEIDRTEMKVKNILLHPQFNGQMNPDSDQFDIAMVKLETPINLNGQIVDEVKEIPDYWSLSNPNNCWVRGQKEHIYSGKGLRNHTLIDIKQLIKEDATLTAPSLPGTPPISYLVSLGAPLICAEAHITGVHGITVRRQSGLISIEMIVYKYTESLVFISLASHKAWIQNVMDHEIDTLKRPFHRDLYNHPQSKNEEKVEDSTVQHNQLEDLKFTLNDTVANL